jgi:hypothetical protein
MSDFIGQCENDEGKLTTRMSPMKGRGTSMKH